MLEITCDKCGIIIKEEDFDEGGVFHVPSKAKKMNKDTNIMEEVDTKKVCHFCTVCWKYVNSMIGVNVSEKKSSDLKLIKGVQNYLEI